MCRSKNQTLPGYRIPSPCLNCETREPACHDRCEKYDEYRQKIKSARDREYEDKRSRGIRPTAPHTKRQKKEKK